MTDTNPSESYLMEQFQALADRLEKALEHIDAQAKNRDLHIPDDKLAAEIGQRAPVARFIKNVRVGCGRLIRPPAVVRSTSAGVGSKAEFFDALNAKISKAGTQIDKSKGLRITDELLKDPRFAKLPIAQNLRRFTQLKNFDEALQGVMNQSVADQLVDRFGQVTGLRNVAGNLPSKEAWDLLHDAMLEKIKEGVCGCSLIYSYWLDEGGLHTAIERVADRVENGIVSSTEALKLLHISERSPVLVDALSAFIVSWQRGELFDVDARRKQYHAQYGFPLHVGRAWGPIATGDPRTGFAAAFHRFLYEVSRYYEAQRDRMKDPDIAATRSALGQLLDTLEEGNENLRRKRTSQIRGQSEYCKRLLGGSLDNTPIADEWKLYLTGRPGIQEAGTTRIWQIKADAVASAYGWSRPRIKEYTALAEAGETILVATRIGGRAAADNELIAEAFAELLKRHVEKYVNAFKVVGAVDLGRQLVAAPPAAVMARNVRPPSIPPLKRHWAAVAPAVAQSNAA